jgi:hypothetical protein
MKKTYIIGFVSVFIVLIAFNQIIFGTASSIQNSRSVGKLSSQQAITCSTTKLKNADGYWYGSEYYLSNNSNQKLRVFWRFEDGKNANVQSDGGITDIAAKKQNVWIARVTADDVTKAWSAGTINFEWKPIN